MEITELILKRYRNYAKQQVLFTPGLNILRGRNAQGKTNIVEAVYLCCVGRSPRTVKDRELISWEEESGYVSAECRRKIGKTKVEIYLTRKEKKRIQINGIPIARMGELMGNIRAVYFSPDELKLVKESPDSRRRFLDIDLSQLKKSYFYALNRYNKILQQRNNLLKAGGRTASETLEIWDRQLASEGGRLIAERAAFCLKLRGFASETHAYLTEGAEELDLSYDCPVWREGVDQAAIAEALLTKLTQSREKDLRLGYTTAGPHRDDIKITSSGVDLRLYGSQGQQRTAALSMKIAELELFAELTGEYPVLLLDDVLSELDYGRQRRLLSRIGGVQTILTCTELRPEVFEGLTYSCKDVEAGVCRDVKEGQPLYDEAMPEKALPAKYS